MPRPALWIAAFSCGAFAAYADVSTLPPARPLAAREVLLDFAADPPESVTAIDAYVSQDGGRSWRLTRSERVGPHRIRCVAPSDGRYEFFLVLKNEHGASSPPPTTGTTPHASVLVDTTPPTLQLHNASTAVNAAGQALLTIRLTLIEEQLSRDGVRLFFRAAASAQPWIDAGDVKYADGRVTRVLSDDIPERIDVRVVATDRAGNRAIDELSDIAVRATTASMPAVRLADRPSDGAVRLAADADSPTSSARSVKIEETGAGRAIPASAPTSTPPTPTVQALRKLAQQFSRDGQFALAGARLRDALALHPNDPDLLSDLGSVLYRSRRYDDAVAAFEKALAEHPDHVDALEGLALVEVTRRRYSKARAQLERLVQLEPDDAGHWLHLGDVEHKLGRRDRATDAWERVLKLDADIELRERASKRLRYFGARRGASRP